MKQDTRITLQVGAIMVAVLAAGVAGTLAIDWLVRAVGP